MGLAVQLLLLCNSLPLLDFMDRLASRIASKTKFARTEIVLPVTSTGGLDETYMSEVVQSAALAALWKPSLPGSLLLSLTLPPFRPVPIRPLALRADSRPVTLFRPVFFPGQLRVGQPLPAQAGRDLREPRPVPALPLVETEVFFVQVAEQVERRDADVGSLDARFNSDQ